LANTKTALKQWKVSLKKRARSRPVRASMRTFLTKARNDVAHKSADAEASVKTAIIALDKAVTKGLVHKNSAARRKSRLMKHFNAISAN